MLHSLCMLVLKKTQLTSVDFRAFLQSKWGMDEFTLAYAEALKRRKPNFIVIILKEMLDIDGLRKDLKMFLKTHNYIDGTKNLAQVPERLR